MLSPLNRLLSRSTGRALGVLMGLLLVSGCAVMVVGTAVVTASAVHDRRTVGTVLDDQVLDVQVRNALYGRPEFGPDDRLLISSYNGWVLLAGEVSSQSNKDLATAIIRELPEVLRLFNELAVMPRPSLAQSGRDRLMSIKAKAAIADMNNLPGFDASRVHVTTARDIIYLQGLVTEQESQRVVDRVRRVPGAQEVVILFEIINEAPSEEASSTEG